MIIVIYCFRLIGWPVWSRVGAMSDLERWRPNIFFRIAATVLFLFALAFPVAAAVTTRIQCNEAQTEFAFDVEIFNQFFIEDDSTGWEVIFEQSRVGGCEEPEIVMTVPLPEPYEFGFHSFTLPVPASNQYFLYTARMKAPDGTIHDINTIRPPSWTPASCGEAVAVRGYLVDADYLGFLNVLPCPDSCETWLCPSWVDLSQVPAEQWQPFVGTGIPMDIYGEAVLYPMSGSPCLNGYAVQPTPEELCAPVATDYRSWGSLKVLYR